MEFPGVSVQRLGLCFGACLLLGIYAGFATPFRLPFFLPIGLALMSSYIWTIVTRLKGIYPEASGAIGQFCITFLIVGYPTYYRLNLYLEQTNYPAEQGQATVEEGALFWIRYLSGVYNITSVMFTGLLIAYIILKIRKRFQGTQRSPRNKP